MVDNGAKKLEKIDVIARKLGLGEDDIDVYGRYMAKILNGKGDKRGKLVLVSAMTPTASGEGKTTVSIGLADAICRLGGRAVLSLREPSLGPVFGIKGGATGGGRARVEPSEDINLHFTGDMHAITSANNLLCALVDNSIFHGNELNIDENRVMINRCIDMNDRSLRRVEINLEGLKGQAPREEGFVITAASEIMALLCLAKDFDDLKERLGNILVAFSRNNKPIYARDLKATDAMAVLLKNATFPNLVQTAEGNPAIIHGGPFANIAHGCSSLIATGAALALGDYVITEGGFGGDLGGEKFLDVKCRIGGLVPSVVVIVATIKAIKLHAPQQENALREGFKNLKKHIENFKQIFNQRVVVALNIFDEDDASDVKFLQMLCKNEGVECAPCWAYQEGSAGCLELANIVIAQCKKAPPKLTFPYNLEDDIKTKIEKLAKKVYGARDVEYSEKAERSIAEIENLAKNLPIVVAKTQYSFSDDPKLLGAPSDFTFHIRDVELHSGSGFVVVMAGKIMLMPGLSKEPNAQKITIDSDMNIHNLK